MRPTSLESGAIRARLLAFLLLLLAGLGAAGPVAAGDAEDLSKLRDQAKELQEAGRDREAIAIFDTIIARAPDDGAAYNERALARWFALQTPAAEGDFADFQAKLCLDAGGPCEAVDKVLADLASAIERLPPPRRAGALYDRARILLERGEAKRALADLDAAIALLPDADDLRPTRAEARQQLGDKAGALADLDAALAARDDPADRVRRAELRREAGDLDGARSDIDEALKQPSDGSGVDWLTKAFELRRALAPPGTPGSETSLVMTVTSAQPGVNDRGDKTLDVIVDTDSAQRFASFTEFHVGSRTQILIEGTVVMEPRITSPITAGQIQIFLGTDFTPEQTAALAARLLEKRAIEVRIAE